ncbi:MAG: Glutaredoxin [Candidatus Nomurabacteria bacterium]|nr:Glutaredoxin [Candidatus Nomurabacteria bacterium]
MIHDLRFKNYESFIILKSKNCDTIFDMLILYTKDNCEYCAKVKNEFANRSISYEDRNIKNGEFLKEVQGYNARTMPFLVDTSANVQMGNSDEIIDYIREYSF